MKGLIGFASLRLYFWWIITGYSVVRILLAHPRGHDKSFMYRAPSGTCTDGMHSEVDGFIVPT